MKVVVAMLSKLYCRSILFLSALGFSLALTGVAQDIDTLRIRAHIEVLAADSLEGRGTATHGEVKAAHYIARQFGKIGLQPKGEFGGYFMPFQVAMRYRAAPGIEHQVKSRNVVGFLDNQADRTIVIGAHYDHLGRGFQAGSSVPMGYNEIHNGADDNASGVSAMLELARYFSQSKIQGYNLLFVAFAAKELSRTGSRYFVGNPPVLMESIAMMFNMDMVGRLRERLVISGWNASPQWREVLPPIISGYNLNYVVDLSGTGSSDHTPFYLVKKPVLTFSTGHHSDYHWPTDEVEKINFAGVGIVIRVIADLIVRLDGEDAPTFRVAHDPKALKIIESNFEVSLGITLDYSHGGPGLEVDQVIRRQPAHRAGVEVGDVIVRMGNAPIGDIYDYMEQLGAHKKGDTIEVEVLRGEERVKMDVTF